ncbi:efflux RND transporter periplasmic adaptor subunit [Pseudoalteromonas xiamenensis]|uniref:efflux RND transporter periplasmic adaptor subunit n=1 Tax=Pseudoalteromonas xiamenensis TaxID=882626 RepID=UPI0035E5CD1B
MDRKIERTALQKAGKPLLIIAIVLVLLGAFYGVVQTNAQGRSQTVDVTSLTITPVKQGAFTDSLQLRGQVVPKTTVYLDTIAGGQVEARLVEQGEYVEKGQPLVRLSNTSLQLDVMSREAQVTEQLNFLRNTQMTMETSRLNLKRDLLEIDLQIKHLERRIKQYRVLAQTGVLAQDKLDELEQDLAYYLDRKALTVERQQQENSIREVQVSQLEDSAKMLDKNLQFARKNLDNLLLRAPVAGYLSELDAEIGASKSSGARLGQIDLPDEYKLVVRLDEFYLNQVQMNMPVVVTLEGQKVAAHVTKIDSRVSQSQFQIEVDLPKQSPDIKRGQSLDVELMFGADNANAVLLARGAFFTTTGGNWIYVVNQDGQVAERRAIRLGKKNRDYFEVLEGLAAGERVITSSYSHFDKAQILRF